MGTRQDNFSLILGIKGLMFLNMNILPTALSIFPIVLGRKNQGISSLVITFAILITYVFDLVVRL